MEENYEYFYNKFDLYGVNYRLVKNKRPLMCNDDLYIAKVIGSVSVKDYLEAFQKDFAIIDRKTYQRYEAWSKTDRESLLHSMRDGMEINSLWLSWDGYNFKIFDAGNRTDTMNSFIYDEIIESQTGAKAHRLKISESTDQGMKKVTFKEFSERSKENFLHKILDINFYIVINRNTWEVIERTPLKVYNLFDTAVDLQCDNLSDERNEFETYVRAQYQALQNGKQMNRMEKRKTSPETRGYLLEQIEDLALFNFPSHLYQFAPKRTDKVDYIAKIGHVVSQIYQYENGSFGVPNEWFGKSKETQLDKLYANNTIENDDSRRLVRFMKDIVIRMDKCREIYRKNVNNGNASIVNGDCYTKQNGWLLSAFFFGWVFQNYIVEDKDEKRTIKNYIELANCITDFFAHTSNWMLQKRTLKSDFFKVNRDSLKGVDQLGYDYIATTDHQNGKGDAITREWWNILVKVIELSNLKKRHQRISFDEKTKIEVLNRQNYRDQQGQPLSIADCEIHHVTPLQYGGTNDIDNLVALTREEHKEIHKNL